jgi:S2P endopeptidase
MPFFLSLTLPFCFATPQIPGITIPWTFVPHLLIAIFMTLAFHELGHALSGANDNKAIDKIGLVVQLFIPAAYVRFKDDHYDLTAWRQLKVYCAGAWHNFVLYGLAMLILSNSVFLFAPLYVPISGGATISYIKFNENMTPLKIGDKIVGVNHCTIGNESDFQFCIEKMLEEDNSASGAVCIPSNWIPSDQKKENIECCDESYNGPIPCWKEANARGNQFCKPARDVWPSTVTYCDDHLQSDPTCPLRQSQQTCAVPSLLNKFKEAGLKLIQLRVQRDDGDPVLLHVRQHPYELLNQLSFVIYEPRWTWMPQFTHQWADHLITICSLLVNFNLITPIISLLPIYGFDGEYTLYAITIWLFPEMDDEKRERGIAWIRNGTTAVGLILFLITVVSALI